MSLSKSVHPYIAPVVIVISSLLLLLNPINPGFALLSGMLVSLIIVTPTHRLVIGRLSKRTLAWSIVGFGFTVHIVTIGHLVVQYLLPTISGIALVLCSGSILGGALGVDALLVALLSAGTAICGASAIASVSAATKAIPEKTSMALGIILVLNSIALFLFPAIGHWLNLSSHTFAVWSALAIHDTSSVIGAAMSYDPASVEIATTVKLARALWIAPVTVYMAHRFAPKDSSSSFKLPWFIWGYLCAATVSSFWEMPASTHELLLSIARTGFMLGIFYTGCTIQLKTLYSLGYRPFVLGILLWVISAAWGLFSITL